MKNTYSIILSFVVLGLLGLLAIPKVPLRLTSGEDERMLTVSYTWPNATPEALEQQVTAPLEGILGTLRGVTHIRSSSGYNTGRIMLQLDNMTETNQIRFEAASLLRQLYRNLPAGLSYPVISMNTPEQDNDEKPLLSLQLNGNETQGSLRKYMEEILKPKLVRLEGIRSVDVHGGDAEEWLVQYDPSLINSLGLSEAMITKAITESNQQYNIGWINTGNGMRQSITLTPRTFTAANFLAIPVIKKEDRIIRLGDVTTVQKRERIASTYFRINGKNALQVVLTAQADVNQLAVAAKVRELVHAIQEELPPGYSIRIDNDATDYVYENLKNTGKQATIAFLLITVLCLIIFRQWKAVWITLLAITINLLLGALVFFVLKINIRLSSLTTLIIATGLITGNTWVAFHHYAKWGNRSVLRSLLGFTLIMGVAFSMIWLLPLEMQNELKAFMVPLITLQLLSLAICNWLVPALMEQLQVSARKHKTSSWSFLKTSDQVYWTIMKLMHRFRWQSVILTLLLFGIPVFQLPQRMEKKTELDNIYNKTIGSEWFSEHGRRYLNNGLGGVLRLFANYVYDKSSYTSDEQTVLYIHAGLPNQSTIEQMDTILLKVESELGKYQEIDMFITKVESGQQGSIVITFKKSYGNGYFPYQLKARVIALSTEMSGIDWNIYGVGQGFNVSFRENNTPTFNVILKGYNYMELENVANKLKEILITHPRIKEVDINKEPGIYGQKDLFVYKLNTDGYYWRKYGIAKNALYKAISPFNARPEPDLYQLIGESYEAIDIQPVTARSFDLTALRSEPLILPDSIGLKLGEHAKLIREKIMPNIRKEDQEYLRQVSFNYMGSAFLGEKFLDNTLKSFEQALPMGYSAKKESFKGWQMETHQQYGLVALSLLLIFIIGAVFLESLRQPFTLIVGIGLSFIGLFLTFYLTGAGFDQGGYTSFLLVTGTVSLPILVVINRYNLQRRKDKIEPLIAYYQAIRIELIPVLLFMSGIIASLTGILVWGWEQIFWGALSVGTIGGLSGSLIVVFFFVPLFLVSKSKE